MIGINRCMTLVAALSSSGHSICSAFPIFTRHPDAADCRDLVEGPQCEDWAKIGECDKNPSFMRHSCARSCGCQVDRTCDGVTPPAKGTGGITAMFERAEQMLELGPTVHSRDPFVMTFDHFVTDEECDAFISTTSEHFERSLAGDVVSPVRTSRQAWCQSGIATECYTHPLTQRVAKRVENVTGVPVANSEFFQVLRYEPGQFYREHHDQNAAAESVMGVRLFTFFIYLHAPEGGGGTRFPRLNLTITPRKGAALLWPNVLDRDLRHEDGRTVHEALPPTAGRKYSANLWLHQYDFRGPNMHGCDMRKLVDRQAHGWPADDVALARATNRSVGWPVLPPSQPSSASMDASSKHLTATGSPDGEHVENDEL